MEDIEQSSLTVEMPDSDSRSSRSLVNSSSSLHSLSGIASYGLIKTKCWNNKCEIFFFEIENLLL